MNYEVGVNDKTVKKIDADSFVVSADGLRFYKEVPGGEKILVAWFRTFDYFVVVKA
jgi:hypothetical protein